MHNPRSLVFSLYTHWDTVEVMVRMSRELAAFAQVQALGAVGKVSPQLDADGRASVLRALVNADVLQTLARSSDLQVNPYVLEFVRCLTREHELGLAAVLQARVAAIREATEALNEGLQGSDIDKVRWSANQLAELFRQIGMQLDQDRHAIFELAEAAKSADSAMPVTQRYRRVLDAFDQYVEPMNQMMDTGPRGTFYRYLEDSERSLDHAAEQLTIQGALYSHRMQLRQVSHQAKELRRMGRMVAQQCADTLLPLRDELRQHNALSAAVSALLSRVRKRGLKRTLLQGKAKSPLPMLRIERGFKLQLGDEVRGIMAAARHYAPQSLAFPTDVPSTDALVLERLDEAAIRRHLRQDLPVDSLLDWLRAHYPSLSDATVLRLFHDLQHESEWVCVPATRGSVTDLQTVRVHHHPHRISQAP